MNRRYKWFPPALGHVGIPLSSRPAALAALGLYSPCRPRAVWMARTARVLVRSFGPRALPGYTAKWNAPMEAEIWDKLLACWREEIGAFSEIAICERAQSTRPRMSLLLLNNEEALGFIKLRKDGAALIRREYRTMKAVWTFQPQFFAVPEPFGFGSVSGWDYLATAALPSSEHGVARNLPLEAIVAEISTALETLPRGSYVSDHWVPAHGDLTPWNLRELPDGKLIVYDWEDATWAPPAADEVLYRACIAVLRNTDPGLHPASEAVRYWQLRVSGRQWSNNWRDRKLARALCRVLERMEDRGVQRNSQAIMPV